MAANVRQTWTAGSGARADPGSPGLLRHGQLCPFVASFPIPPPLGKEEKQNIPWERWSGFHNREPLSDQLGGPGRVTGWEEDGRH